MADSEVVKETMRQAAPLDVMVATFADRQAARDAYQTLKTMDKQGVIDMDSAVVIDRSEQGKMRLEGAMLPGWLWTMLAGVGVLVFGMIGAIVWLGMMAARGMRMSREQEGGYTTAEREREREGVRMGME